MKKIILFSFTCVSVISLTGCVTSDHKVTGQIRPPVSADTVQVYRAMPSQAEVIGLLDAHSYAGLTFNQAYDGAIGGLKKEAAALGANGIVLTTIDSQPSQGVKMKGEAVHVSP